MTDQVLVRQAALNKLLVRGEAMNTQILGIIRMLQNGRVDQAVSQARLLQEANCRQVLGLIDAGAVVSTGATLGGGPTAGHDGPMDADLLDLGELRREFAGER